MEFSPLAHWDTGVSAAKKMKAIRRLHGPAREMPVGSVIEQ
jgi:hypothetical protein